MTTRRRFLAITGAAMAFPGGARATTRWQGRALGAEVAITLNGQTASARDHALAEVRGMLARIEGLFSLYDPSSALSRLNRDGSLSDPDPAFVRLLTEADAIHRATNGAFDPTVQPLWRALAEGGDAAAARALIGWDRLQISPAAVTLGPGQALTLNGIAQGFATDCAVDLLKAAGFAETLVNIGEFRALGGPWSIGIADPAEGIVATRRLTGAAIATSSPGAMHLTREEAHILSPGGQPIHWSTVSVEAADATTADGLSTACCHMTRDQIEAARNSLSGVGPITVVSPEGDLRTL